MPERLWRRTMTEELVRFNERGRPEKVWVVHYYVGKDGPFTEDFTPAEFTPENVRTRLDEVAKRIAGVEEGY